MPQHFTFPHVFEMHDLAFGEPNAKVTEITC